MTVWQTAQQPCVVFSAEIRRLQKELKRVTDAQDILKKAAAYFAKLSDRGTSLSVTTPVAGLVACSVGCWMFIPVAFRLASAAAFTARAGEQDADRADQIVLA